MHNSRRPQPDEVDQLLRNAELRDELERYFDESISRVNVQHFSLAAENEFLAAMLAWEQAPVLPIYRWFEPELRPPRPESLGDADLHRILWEVVRKLSQRRIVLDFTDHLNDRELYRLVFRDILPARKEDRLAEQLSALGLHGRQLRPRGVAPLLRHRRGTRGLGRNLSPALAVQGAVALPP